MSDIQDLGLLKTAIKAIDHEAVTSIEAKHLSIVASKDRSVDVMSHKGDAFAEVLIPNSININEPYAVKCTGNGNCLYNSVSIIICGDESLATNLRILTACELFFNGDIYLQHPVLHSVVKNPVFMSKHMNDARSMIFPSSSSGKNYDNNFSQQLREVTLSTCKDKEWSGLVHFMALSTVLQIPIHSVYPDVNQAIRPLFNTVLHPVRSSKQLLVHTDTMHILWSRDGCLDNREGALYEPNHFVPIVMRKSSKGEKRPHSKSTQEVKQARWKKVKKDTNQPQIGTFFKTKVKMPSEQSLHTDDSSSYKKDDTNSNDRNNNKPAHDKKSENKTKTDNNEKIHSESRKEGANDNSKANEKEGMKFESVRKEKSKFSSSNKANESDDNSDSDFDISDPSNLECTDGICCTVDRPYQPLEKEVLRQMMKTTSTRKKKVSRTVQGKWFADFPWLTLCLTKKKLLCFTCRGAVEKNLLQLSKNAENAFARDGFNNWKKAIKRFREHENSHAHREASYKMENLLKQKESVTEQVHTQGQKEQEERRSALYTQTSSLKYLLRQGMATRGHHDSEGNFIQLLRLRAEDNPLLQTWIENGRYLSPEIVNEQISLIGQNILRHLLDSVKTSKWYSVMADECMDVSYEEQLVICVRWVDSDLQIHEDMLGLLKIESQTSNYITAAIKDILLRCGLPLELCWGQAYDGAPNMSGHLSGVAKQIQDQSPSALGVHCLAHCINLCVQDVTKKMSAGERLHGLGYRN